MSSFIQRVNKFCTNPSARFAFLTSLGVYDFLSDETFVKKEYKSRFGTEPNLDNPVTYNEKIQWLKLFDRNPRYIKLVDKHEAKKFAAEKIGEQYVIKELGLWDNPDDIDLSGLPQQFVMKTTHDSGCIYICKDKSHADLDFIKSKMKKGIKRDYFMIHREWPYKNVPKRVLAEEYMEDSQTSELRDYKFFCFNGKARMMFIASDRQNSNTDTKFDFFDMDFNHLDIKNGHPNSCTPISKPVNFNLMIQMAEILSEGIPHVRVDFYEVNGKVYFGEMTFYHWSGLVAFEPQEWDLKLGNMIDLTTVHKN